VKTQRYRRAGDGVDTVTDDHRITLGVGGTRGGDLVGGGDRPADLLSVLPPLRYRGGGLPPRSASYQDFGLRAFYDLFFPHVRGRRRRELFNGVSGLMALWFGVLGAVAGWAMLGPLGVVIGLGAGLALGANFLIRNQHYRP
jgi:hypothetical protein